MSNLIRADRRHIVAGVVVPSGVVAVSGGITRLLGPYDLLNYPHKSFTVYNQSAVTLSGAAVRINFDWRGNEPGSSSTNQTATLVGPNDGLWEVLDSTSFNSLPAGTIKTAHFSTQTARWWDVIVVNNQTPTITVTGSLNACAV